jgi:hypothetical protein
LVKIWLALLQRIVLFIREKRFAALLNVNYGPRAPF